jgi:hypothetical protein
MSSISKNIYPYLIILFSTILIFGIIHNKKINTFNSKIENFINNEINNGMNNMNQTKSLPIDMINGSWTHDETTVDSNYIVSNSMTITIYDVHNPKNIGTITYKNKTYTITFLINDNLTAILSDDNQTLNAEENIHIKFYNYLNNTNNNNNEQTSNLKPEDFNAVVSVYSNNTLMNKFASYKIYGETVGNELYRMIVSGKMNMNEPPELYDYKSYTKITGNYVYPENFITINFGNSNPNILNLLQTNYNGTLKFCIQRVFHSPTNENTEIITKISPTLSLNVINNGQIPNTLMILPFIQDQIENNVDSFFKPKATILYFYKFTSINTTYDFTNPTIISQSNSVLKLKNNASQMTAPTIQFNNLTSIQQVLNNNYTLTQINRYPSNLKNMIFIPFSDLFDIL